VQSRPGNLEHVFAAARRYAQRHWQGLLRLRQRIRLSEQTIHLLLAGFVGIAGGLANLAFHLGTEAIETLALQANGIDAEMTRALVWWQRLLIPTAGGLAAGACLYWGLRLIGWQGSTNLLEVVVAGNGRLPFRSGLIKSIASMLSISTGASIGREGMITQFSATIASKLGQYARWQPYRLRMLVACGAASGMAAAYNAPIGGAVFAAQIVLGNFSMNLFAPLLVSSVIAAMVSRSFFGLEPWYRVPSDVEFTRITQLPWFLLLGFLAGASGAAFLKLLRWSEKIFNPLPLPLPVRMAVGGLAVGALAIRFPGVWGNGYEATNEILHGQFLLGALAGLFIAKLIAILISVGSGAVGGVFTPTLFLGAGLGGMFAALLHLGGFAHTLPTPAFVLVGMSSMLAATTHSPLLAMIMVFEISLNYTLAPPLMVACAVSTLVSRAFHADSIYTEPLRQRGMDIETESARVGASMEQTVGDLMHDPVAGLKQTAGLREIADRFLKSANNFLPVLDEQGRFVGVVALHDLKEHLGAGQEIVGVIAFDVMRPPPPSLTPNQKLVDALPILLVSEQSHVPVINTATERRLVGAIHRSEVLSLLSEAIAPRSPRNM
jgi:CIC family chloride channel protein